MLVKPLFVLGLLSMLFVGYEVWQNNRPVPRPDRSELKHSLDMGIAWLSKNRDVILNDNNDMLWWMVQESAKLTQNPELKDLFARYQLRYFSGKRKVWSHLFDSASDVPMRLSQLENLPDYNLFILYGVSCSPELGEADIVRRQLKASFCDSKPLSPACVTHQMMGFRFMRQSGCGDRKEVDSQLAILGGKVSSQLTWDFRVVDVYVQRVLMLVDAGAIGQVKPVWIRRILDAQDNEGGWDGFHPVIPVFGGKYIGFTQKWISAKSNKANFHATAQGVLLMSLLLNGESLQ